MGLIREVLLLPTAPVRYPVHGIGWVLGQVVRVAEEEYYDPAVVQRELKLLEEDLLNGRVDEAEFDRREDELLDRLEEAQRWHAARAAAASGGAPPGAFPGGGAPGGAPDTAGASGTPGTAGTDETGGTGGSAP